MVGVVVVVFVVCADAVVVTVRTVAVVGVEVGVFVVGVPALNVVIVVIGVFVDVATFESPFSTVFQFVA